MLVLMWQSALHMCCTCTGRHPLCELLAADTFIDNDTTLGSLGSSTAEVLAATPAVVGAGADTHASRQHNSAAGPRLLLITGPNASGKSVYMKQVKTGAEGH